MVGRDEEVEDRKREMGLLGLVMEVVVAVKGERERRGEVWREREDRDEELVYIAMVEL